MKKILFLVLTAFAFNVFAQEKIDDPAPNTLPSKKETVEKERALDDEGMTGYELKFVGTKKKKGDDRKSDDKKKGEVNKPNDKSL